MLNPNEKSKLSGASGWGPNDNEHVWGCGGAEPPHGVPRLVSKVKGANAKLGDEPLAVPPWGSPPNPTSQQEDHPRCLQCEAWSLEKELDWLFLPVSNRESDVAIPCCCCCCWREGEGASRRQDGLFPKQ